MPFPWSRRKPEPVEKVHVKGKKVILREKRIQDVAEDDAWRTDEELARLDATRPISMSFDDFIRYSEDELAFPSPRSRRFGVDTHDGKHIGNCMYYDTDLRRGEAELGVMIGDRDYWGKGYGTDAVNALLNYIFTTTPLTRMYLHTLEWNTRALKSFAKSGFSETKKVRRSGLDFVQMEIWRSEWERLRMQQAEEEGETFDPDEQAIESTEGNSEESKE